jgi:soluble P-type ATPase
MALDAEDQARLDALRAVGEAACALLKKTICASRRLEVSMVVSDTKLGVHVFVATTDDLETLRRAVQSARMSVEHVAATGVREADLPLPDEMEP